MGAAQIECYQGGFLLPSAVDRCGYGTAKGDGAAPTLI